MTASPWDRTEIEQPADRERQDERVEIVADQKRLYDVHAEPVQRRRSRLGRARVKRLRGRRMKMHCDGIAVAKTAVLKLVVRAPQKWRV